MGWIETLRKYRVWGIAVFDLVTALLGMTIIFYFAWKWHFRSLSKWPFLAAALLLTLPVGIFVHVIFGVNTTLNSYLRLSFQPDAKTKTD